MTTTASSIPFATMEAPALDDTMEMASPYQGQVDDFEIDLDVMEDQMSNPDKDMTAADDEAPTSNVDLNQYGPNDTDMTDDVAERAMVDADDQGLGHVDLRYGEDIYEADMVEDNYDEDIDAPLLNGEAEGVQVTLEDHNDQGPGEQAQPADGNDLAEETRHESVVEHPVETWENHADEHLGPQGASKPHVDHAPGTVPEPPQIRTETAEEGLRETNSTERVDTQLAHTDGDEVDQADLHHREHDRRPGDKPQHLAEEPKDQHVQETEKEEVYEPNGRETDTSHHAPLHPLKVYYQDNEISLFPPREGDASETFLLEDENLAFADFGKLFYSCREVLQESIAEDELLVVDIESLNIQLTEESSHLSQVTLHQIVDLYVRLCHNEDIVEPEPLYLTLSTKPTIPVQLSELLASVNEGKGLSDIQQWDDYDETVPVSADGHEGQSDQELNVAPEQDTAAHHVPQEVPRKAEPSVHSQDTWDRPEEQEIGGVVELEGEGEEGEASAPDAEAEAEDGQDEEKEPGDNVQNPLHRETSHHSPNEGAYDSEAQKSESSATLAQQLPDEQYEGSASAPLDDQVTDGAHGEPDAEEAADGDYDDPEAADHGEYDDAEGAADGEYHDTEEAVHEAYDDDYGEAEAANGPEREDHGASEADENEVIVAGSKEDLTQAENWSDEEGELHPVEGEDDGSLGDDPELKQAITAQDGSESNRKGAELTDDLLGLSEDLDNPAEDQVEPGEVHTDASQTIPDQGDDWTFDDEDHVDLGTKENTETSKAEPSTDSHAPENVATKRTREPEEEGEVDENPTPDTKRRRSS